MKLRQIREAQKRKNKIISAKCASGYVASRTFMQMDPMFATGALIGALAMAGIQGRGDGREFGKFPRIYCGAAGG